MVDPLQIIEKFYRPDTELYHVLITHSEQVKEKAVSIAIKHPEFNFDIKFIQEASLLHDIGIFMCHAPRIYCTGTHAYIEHGYLGAELLRNEGLERHALVCERHTGVGISKQMILDNHLPLPHRDFLPLSMEEKLICYADTFFSKTKLGEEYSAEQIRTFLLQFGAENVAVFNRWDTLFKPLPRSTPASAGL